MDRIRWPCHFCSANTSIHFDALYDPIYPSIRCRSFVRSHEIYGTRSYHPIADGERRSLISAKWLMKVFILGDVLSFLMQSSGTSLYVNLSLLSLSANAHSGGGIMVESMQMGENIIIGGLVLQVIFFGLFVIVALCFHYKLSCVPTERIRSSYLPWKRHLAALYISSGLILVRSIFRVVEYAQGNAGYLLKHEYFLYVFDSTLILGVMVFFTLVHPSEINALLKGGKASTKGDSRYNL